MQVFCELLFFNFHRHCRRWSKPSTMNDLLNYLHRITPIEPNFLLQLQLQLQEIQLDRDEFLLKTGLKTGHLYFLSDGLLLRCVEDDSSSRISRLYAAPSVIHLAEPSGKGDRSRSYLRAETKAQLWHLSEQDTAEALRFYDSITKILQTAAEEDLKFYAELSKILQLTGAKNKVVAFHQWQSAIFSQMRSESVAALLALNPSTVYRVRKMLKL
jgi:CRP-like cAMP-binding protein